MESSSVEIHEYLNAVLDYQTHHRLRESQGRIRAEELNERVLYWSLGEYHTPILTLLLTSEGFGDDGISVFVFREIL